MNDSIYNVRLSDYTTQVEIYDPPNPNGAHRTSYATFEEGDALALIEHLLNAIEQDGPQDMIHNGTEQAINEVVER